MHEIPARMIEMLKSQPVRMSDEFYMGMAVAASKASEDPHTKVGACIVAPSGQIVSTGVNCFPRGRVGYPSFPWEREGRWLDTKYPYVVHAEVDAVFAAFPATRGCAIFLTLFPCCDCAKILVLAGVAEVVYLERRNDDTHIAAERIFEECGVRHRKLEEST